MQRYQRLVYDDRLLIEVVSNGTTIRQGKRVSSDCPLRRDEIRKYVADGPIAAVKLIRSNRSCTLHEALSLLNQARYYHNDSRWHNPSARGRYTYNPSQDLDTKELTGTLGQLGFNVVIFE